MNEKSFKRDMENAPFHVATIFDDPDDPLWLWNKIFLQIAKWTRTVETSKSEK